MLVRFDYRETCALCGCRVLGMLLARVRVNKNSLRTLDTSLSAVMDCPECGPGWPVKRFARPVAERWSLSPEDAAKVATAAGDEGGA